MSNNAVELRNFSFRYRDAKKYAIRHVNLEIPEGSFCCLVGSNGSGKSTLCNAVVGLIPHHFSGELYGEVQVFGSNVAQKTVAEISSQVGFVFQDPFSQLSYTATTVAEELAYGMCNRGIHRDEMIRRVREVAHAVRVEEYLDCNPLELSGGEVQRIALGSVLVLNPRILILDECTTQLDPLGSEEIMNIILRLNKKGMTVLMVEHDMERVARLANIVIALETGNVIALGTPAEVFCKPNLINHGIAIPDYVGISESLRSRRFWDGPVALVEQDAVKCVKEALSR